MVIFKITGRWRTT